MHLLGILVSLSILPIDVSFPWLTGIYFMFNIGHKKSKKNTEQEC